MDRRRVVITGLGAVTPLGLTMQESWQAVREGRCGIGPITQYDTAGQKVTLAAEVRGFDPEAYMPRAQGKHMGRFTQFAVAAAVQALADAGLTAFDPDRCGVAVSSGIGGQIITEAEHLRGMERGFDRVSPFYIPMAISNMAAGQVAIAAGFRGMCTCPVTACAGGSNAVGDAFRHIRDGYADVMLCGGTEASITPLAIGGFTSMKALTQAADPNRASIPFDAERMTGHMLGAAGAVEAAFTALALRDGFVPATINYRTPDPECDLDIVANTGRRAELRAAMSNSLGFGGHNVSLVMRRWEDA